MTKRKEGDHTGSFDEIPFEGDHPEPLSPVRYPRRLLQILRHQSVPQREIKGGPDPIITDTNQIVQTMHVLGPATQNRNGIVPTATRDGITF